MDLQSLWDALDADEAYKRKFWNDGAGWVLVSSAKPIIQRWVDEHIGGDA